jgi:hypothetical protein
LPNFNNYDLYIIFLYYNFKISLKLLFILFFLQKLNDKVIKNNIKKSSEENFIITDENSVITLRKLDKMLINSLN